MTWQLSMKPPLGGRGLVRENNRSVPPGL
uniref:Uncharacterized protein n=1 Tax=Anguilla anguilla TaxID=7936 RepID=A0A0E9T0F3_ANGAN